jgi:hypothetical protein
VKFGLLSPELSGKANILPGGITNITGTGFYSGSNAIIICNA